MAVRRPEGFVNFQSVSTKIEKSPASDDKNHATLCKGRVPG